MQFNIIVSKLITYDFWGWGLSVWPLSTAAVQGLFSPLTSLPKIVSNTPASKHITPTWCSSDVMLRHIQQHVCIRIYIYIYIYIYDCKHIICHCISYHIIVYYIISYLYTPSAVERVVVRGVVVQVPEPIRPRIHRLGVVARQLKDVRDVPPVLLQRCILYYHITYYEV